MVVRPLAALVENALPSLRYLVPWTGLGRELPLARDCHQRVDAHGHGLRK